jgi:cytosine/creatinine deaminase
VTDGVPSPSAPSPSTPSPSAPSPSAPSTGAAGQTTSWITNARLANGQIVDVSIVDGLISTVEPTNPSLSSPNGQQRTGTVERLDGSTMLLGSPVEPHAHLDKVLTAQEVPNPKGDLMGAIEGWVAYFPTLTVEAMISRSTQAVYELVASGITAVRTHVNVHEGIDLKAMEALLAVKHNMAHLCDIQVVSLTGWVSGETPSDLANRRLLRQSVELDPSVVVGGCPHLEHDRNRATDIALDLAGELGRDIDLHTDENLDAESADLRYLAQRIIATGYRGRAAASHCCSLAMQDEGLQRDTAALVAEAGVSVVALPQTNLFLQARDVKVAPPRGLTALRILLDAGVNLAGGADNVRDPFNSMGRHDPTETAALLVMAGHLLPDEAWKTVTLGARTALGLPPSDIRPGDPADLVAIPGADLADCLAKGDQQRIVWKSGRVVARTTLTRHFG